MNVRLPQSCEAHGLVPGRIWLVGAALAVFLLTCPARGEEGATAKLPPAAQRPVTYEKDIQPILARHCYSCHGAEKQESSFRLDQRAAAMKGGELGEPPIVAGDSARSLLVLAVAGLDENLLMPPEGEQLSADEIGLLRAWIDQGAKWPAGNEPETSEPLTSDHWSFQPLSAAPVPASDDPRIANPIDAFLLARLRAEGLDFSDRAPSEVFIRRLYLDTLGLPPSPEQVAAFAADASPDAVERLVEQALASPRYGERWARHWLDVVRFAETSGFETNVERATAYHYRDYVIQAFNEDKPYNRFITEQLAGDALGVDAATGFLVGGPNDRVKSPDPTLTLMQRQDELADMLNTTGTAFLGLTVGCARCHNHKFDPVTQRDYYSLQAVFAGVEHAERPLAATNRRIQQERLAEVEKRLAAAREELSRVLALREPPHPKVNEERFPPAEVRFVRFWIEATNTGSEPCLDELEIYAAVDGESVNVALASRGAIATASGVYPNSAIHRLEHINDGRLGNGRSWISNTPGAGWVQIELPQPLAIDRIVWGRDREERYQDRLPTAYRIEGAVKPDEWRILASSADRAPAGANIETAWAERIARLPDDQRLEASARLGQVAQLQSERDALQASLNVMVYAGSFRQPEATHRLYRGDPMQPREPVAPAAPEVFAGQLGLQPLPADAPEQSRRQHLAAWIASPENPLTARVIVNRLWHYHFGTGLVATPSDFGKMGAAPSHPELLDWLACELIRNDWSLKHIQRLILTSWAYRQSSQPHAAGLRADAESRLLWRFPSRRLEAEAIRDHILSVSGALDLAMYGPGYSAFKPNTNYVRVYEPKETWTRAEWRRMVYMLKVRMENDAVFGAFDCPDAGQPTAQRPESTTPLQALNLLHSSFILQQAELCAARLQREAGDAPAAQVQRAFVLAFGRAPAPEEAAAAESLVQRHSLAELCRALFNANEFLFVP